MVSAVWIVGVSVLHRGLYPKKAVTINLAPANVRKEGVGFDLAIAIGILGGDGAGEGGQSASAGGGVVTGWDAPPGPRSAIHRRLCAAAWHREYRGSSRQCRRGGGY
jgi:hypothetical protein